MAQSSTTDIFQTTIPVEVRRALKLRPRQRVPCEICADGSAVMRPAPAVDELFGNVRVTSVRLGVLKKKSKQRKKGWRVKQPANRVDERFQVSG